MPGLGYFVSVMRTSSFLGCPLYSVQSTFSFESKFKLTQLFATNKGSISVFRSSVLLSKIWGFIALDSDT